MGYAVLHLDKAPGNEAAMTAHIARTKIPTNASPERTCLNEELVEFPEEVADRTEAINYRLEHAGLTRKIGTNQVRVIRVMLTGSHDAMKRIEEEGRLPEWCADNLAWLRETFGAENVVSAVVHRDESTPHIHAAVVPIVTGERRKARTAASETPGKRHYRTKSAARPRLCADDVMSRVRLKQYQDSYAATMSKYGLERGIDGSEARHITTQEFYRQAIAPTQLGPCVASPSFLIIRIDDATRVLPEYVCGFLNLPTTRQLLNAQSKGTSIASLSKTDIEELEIPLPSLERQQTCIVLIRLQRREQALYKAIAECRRQLIDYKLKKAYQNER